MGPARQGSFGDKKEEIAEARSVPEDDRIGNAQHELLFFLLIGGDDGEFHTLCENLSHSWGEGVRKWQALGKIEKELVPPRSLVVS